MCTTSELINILRAGWEASLPYRVAGCFGILAQVIISLQKKMFQMTQPVEYQKLALNAVSHLSFLSDMS